MERSNGLAKHERKRIAMAMISVFALLAAIVAGAGWQSSLAQTTQTKPEATIRFLNASPGSPAIDILKDGQPIAANLAFGTSTEYASLADGKYTFEIVPTGQSESSALAKQDVEVKSGNAYIVAAVNSLKDISVQSWTVDLDAVGSGKTRVRLIQESTDAGKVDLGVSGGDTWFSGVDNGDSTDYKSIDAGTYSLDVKQGDRVLYTANTLNLEEGRTYDLFLVGQLSDKSLALLPLVTNVSEPCASVLNIKGGDQDACIRILHAAPGSPAVDVYVNGSPLVTSLAYGTATDFATIPSGDNVKVQIVPAGSSLDNALIDNNYSFDSGQAYQIFATGAPDDLKAVDMEVDLTPLPKGQARVRVTHASPDAGKVDVGVANGDQLFGGLSFRDATKYKVVDASSYTLQITKSGQDTILLNADENLKEATVYDLVVIGRSDDSSLALLVLTAPASVRNGEVATPEVAGTPSGAATVSPVIVSPSAVSGTVVPTQQTSLTATGTPAP